MKRLEGLEIYQLSMVIGELVWKEVMAWDYFTRASIGMQLVKCSDSIAANIAEGYGRNTIKETKQFCYYSRGSLKETVCFLQKIKNRTLMNEEILNNLTELTNNLGIKLNNYIKYLNSQN
jgi:four helix bundle protein